MVDENVFSQNDDAPKANPWRDDRLGHGPFAKHLFKAVSGLNAPNGFVIGLHGQWGSGKTTILNFLKAFLDKHNAEVEQERDRVTVIDFQPWLISGHHDLIVAFFKLLSEELGPREPWLVRAFRRVAKNTAGTSDGLIDAAATLALAFDVTGGVASKAGGELAKTTIRDLAGAFLSTPSVQNAYRELHEQLRRSDRKFLVTIDDLDRLKPEEVKSVFQMVKTVGNLPNVIYLLSYDRDVVWQYLDQQILPGRPSFGEKIVQQEIAVPVPTRRDLLAILEQQSHVFTLFPSRVEAGRVVLLDGIHQWIKSPRDAVRFANAINYSWAALYGEIDPMDLIAMEGLRLFDENVFSWIAENEDFLCRKGRYEIDLGKEGNAVAESLKSRLNSEALPSTLRLIVTLFPSRSKLFEGYEVYGSEFSSDVLSRRGIDSDAGYRAYFSLWPSSEAIDKSDLVLFFESLGQAPVLTGIFTKYIRRTNSDREPMIVLLLEEVRARFESTRPPTPTKELLEVLLLMGEQITLTKREDDRFFRSPRTLLLSLINRILACWPIEEADANLVSCFKKLDSAFFAAEVFSDQACELGLIGSRTQRDPAISEEALAAMGEHLLDALGNAKSAGKLEQAPYYFRFARAWEYLDGPSDPRIWISEGMMRSADFLVNVGRGLTSYTVGSMQREYGLSEKPRETLYDLNVVRTASKQHLKSSELSDDERRLIEALLQGADRYLQLQNAELSNDARPPPQ